MGGTFDPIHNGHLLMAEEARQAFRLDRVVFVPNGRPAHKKAYRVTSPEDRFNMTELAIAGNPQFACSRIELDRPGLSYTLDTVREFRREEPNLDALYFITGADAILQILTWHEANQLADECLFIAATRPGFDLERLREIVPARFLERVTFLSIPGLEISSTDLRRRAREGRSLRYLIPETVLRYIEAHGLYLND
jgi:nicotinate-nucleotide adenylyltransferase